LLSSLWAIHALSVLATHHYRRALYNARRHHYLHSSPTSAIKTSFDHTHHVAHKGRNRGQATCISFVMAWVFPLGTYRQWLSVRLVRTGQDASTLGCSRLSGRGRCPIMVLPASGESIQLDPLRTPLTKILIIPDSYTPSLGPS